MDRPSLLLQGLSETALPSLSSHQRAGEKLRHVFILYSCERHVTVF